MRALVNSIAASVLIPAATYAADNTPAKVDLLGFEGAVIAIHIGVGGITFDGTNKVEFKLTHPASYFTDMLTLPAFSPAPKEYDQYLPASPELAQKTISDGPYKIDS